MSIVGELIAELAVSVVGEAAWDSTSRRVKRVVKFLLLAIVWAFIGFFFFGSLYSVVFQSEPLGLLVSVPSGLLAWVMIRERRKVHDARRRPRRRERPPGDWHGPAEDWNDFDEQSAPDA